MKDQEEKYRIKKTPEEIIEDFGRMAELMRGRKAWKLIEVYNQTVSFEHRFATVVLSGTVLMRHSILPEYTYEDFFETFICDNEIEIEIDIW